MSSNNAKYISATAYPVICGMVANDFPVEEILPKESANGTVYLEYHFKWSEEAQAFYDGYFNGLSTMVELHKYKAAQDRFRENKNRLLQNRND